MKPFPIQMDVTGKYIEDSKTIKPDTLAILITPYADIVFKSLTINKEEKVGTGRSRM
ncbi:hypothetical protein [Sphingobacterium sp. IITKGP-BTPF85]|uniref:hypothetical protein n=1 Tax=Sphingobacterium sp. IITKGP-BTPF85 TaxID=1338009 RepID=UPI00038A152E|nr:hypothetical protein [Sphingobacterium sp. IITKGP-BTPF85]KKX47710.1 hypothetical protein L950_0225000 [Sphingobacterium sp. IITKGP-BTPF85]